MTRELKGRHVLIIAIAAFGTIIAANMAMLFAATGTFPGLVVKNAYVASQGWDERAASQRNLGWTARLSYDGGAIRLELTGADGQAVSGAGPEIRVGRPTTTREDQTLTPVFENGVYVARTDLAPGRWRIDVTAGKEFAAGTEIIVPDAD